MNWIAPAARSPSAGGGKNGPPSSYTSQKPFPGPPSVFHGLNFPVSKPPFWTALSFVAPPADAPTAIRPAATNAITPAESCFLIKTPLGVLSRYVPVTLAWLPAVGCAVSGAAQLGALAL